MKRHEAFTLIELMLVVVIIATLAALVIPRFTGRAEQAMVAAARADVQANIPTALELFELDTGSYPTTDEGLNSLLQAPLSAPVNQRWKGPYLKRKPVDPWGKPYQYRSPGTRNPAGYDLFSLGKDGVESGDDIGNWESS